MLFPLPQISETIKETKTISLRGTSGSSTSRTILLDKDVLQIVEEQSAILHKVTSVSCKRILVCHNEVKLWACNSRLSHPCAREFGSVRCIIEFTRQTFIRVGLYKNLFQSHRVNGEFDF